jgi:hypothetical protein
MSDRITRSCTATTPDGLVITVDDYVDVDATDKIEQTIPKSSVPKEISLHPEGATVEFIAITATRYSDLSVQVGAGSPVLLTKALVLMGNALVGLLGAETAVMTFLNTNTLTDNAVTILVGRSALVEEGS